jgi:putative ABC transport system ATP-binding protein
VADLRIKDLVVEYCSGGYAVRPINELTLDVREGSLAILLGPSGCGKTTLLSCLGGILKPAEGRIELGDIDITGLDRRTLPGYRRNTVGIVFQAFNLVASLTALENVMVPLVAARVPRGRARERAEELLSRVGLEHRKGHRPGDMSGGQQQRVAIARAIALDPPLLLADEPTAHLDFMQVEEVLKLIRELASGERIVVVATHDARILPIADQVIELAPAVAAVEHEPVTVHLDKDEVLFEQGTMGDCIYVVADGEIELVRELADGGEEVVKIAPSRHYFGEMGPLFSLPRSATARARRDSTVIGYTVQQFRERLGGIGNRDIIEHKELDGG